MPDKEWHVLEKSGTAKVKGLQWNPTEEPVSHVPPGTSLMEEDPTLYTNNIKALIITFDQEIGSPPAPANYPTMKPVFFDYTIPPLHKKNRRKMTD